MSLLKGAGHPPAPSSESAHNGSCHPTRRPTSGPSVPTRTLRGVEVVLAEADDGVQVHVLGTDPTGTPPPVEALSRADLPRRARALEAARPRWVWADTGTLYPGLLAAGVRLERCYDLHLCQTILHRALGGAPPERWQPAEGADPGAAPTLFDSLALPPGDVLAEHRRQRAAVAQAPDPGRLGMLLAVESAGALLAAEMRYDGLPWSREAHDRVLTDLLGPRPHHGAPPAALACLAEELRAALDAPRLNPDSPVELLRALRAAGIDVRTTRTWELREVDHPAIAPLLTYKKLARLYTANGWAWADAWVRPGPRGRDRLQPDYVPGGVVTGRWATRGGGALQLPKAVRSAVVADPGWSLVVADAAQLEPRVLAAMSRDERMAAAGRGTDLYQGLVDSGVVDTRSHAKVAMLGALYGATTGEAGDLVPRLRQAFPRALGAVEEAARAGEAGKVVRTWLGRTSPPPPESWHEVQRRASEPDATDVDRRRAGRSARDWGRFTRNFVVQGTAAEWALCWMADLRGRLRALTPDDGGTDDAGTGDGGTGDGGTGDGGAATGPHLAFFLHDEVIVHTPSVLADDVAAAVREAAASAGRLLFGTFPVDFPLEVHITQSYGDADAVRQPPGEAPPT